MPSLKPCKVAACLSRLLKVSWKCSKVTQSGDRFALPSDLSHFSHNGIFYEQNNLLTYSNYVLLYNGAVYQYRAGFYGGQANDWKGRRLNRVGGNE